MGEKDAVSATNSQAYAALELGVLQVVTARADSGGLRLFRLRVVAVGGHPRSLPDFASPGEERSSIVRKSLLLRDEVGGKVTEPAASPRLETRRHVQKASKPRALWAVELIEDFFHINFFLRNLSHQN
jgi:hypothetical protein